MDLLWAPWKLSSLKTNMALTILPASSVLAYLAHSSLHGSLSTHWAGSRLALSPAQEHGHFQPPTP